MLRQQAYDNGGRLLKEVESEYNYSSFGSMVNRTVMAHTSQDNKNIICVVTNDPVTNGQQVWKGSWETYPNCSQTRYVKTKFQTSGYTFTGQRKLLARQIEKRFDETRNAFVYNEKRFTYDYLPDAGNQTLSSGAVMLNQPWKREELTSNNE